MTRLSHDRNPDPATIAGIAREVIKRLRLAEPCDAPANAENAETLITIDTLNRLNDGKRVFAATGAVITPAARDEAKLRGIQIVSATSQTLAERNSHPSASVDTTSDPIQNQLTRRGLVLPSDVELIWTEQPADEVIRRCQAGQRAAMVTSLSDVDRFAAEADPNVWVLDRKRLNLTAATNIAARIAQRSRTRRSPGVSS